MSRNTVQDPEATECHCGTVPLSHLGLDIDEPMSGWPAFFRERNIEVAPDDLGRPSVSRQVLGDLLAEDREREARVTAQWAEQAAARRAPVPAGVPALDDASPYESMVAAGGIVTPAQEFGGGRTPVFQELLDERLAEGRRQAADERAERGAVERARKLLDGRDK